MSKLFLLNILWRFLSIFWGTFEFCLSFCLFISLSVCLFVGLYDGLSDCLFVYLFVCLSVFWFICFLIWSPFMRTHLSKPPSMVYVTSRNGMIVSWAGIQIRNLSMSQRVNSEVATLTCRPPRPDWFICLSVCLFRSLGKRTALNEKYSFIQVEYWTKNPFWNGSHAISL